MDIFPRMQKEYDSKSQFIKEFIKSCRITNTRMQELSNTNPMFVTKDFWVCDEHWKFEIFISPFEVKTRPTYYKFVNGRDLSVHYPLTIWGEPYSRWDYELREFLDREICKS